MAFAAGNARPPNCTALGKALLALLPMSSEEIPNADIQRATRAPSQILHVLEKELTRVVQQGFAMDDQKLTLGRDVLRLHSGRKREGAPYQRFGSNYTISRDGFRHCPGTKKALEPFRRV